MVLTNEILENIYAKPEVQKVPFSYKSTMIRAIEDVLEEMGVIIDDAVSKPES